ncbi:hypothetical protein ABZY90_19605 [Streptomyces sp. NPDC006422]|uniref:hypothetical protein n=1 Tax=unclassified Streptomyces TaxID=2593676 RepID=UPI0033A159C3
MGESMRAEQYSQVKQKLKNGMPLALDAIGLMLLSGSAMMWHIVAGTAAAGISCFYLNRRIFGGR